MPKNYMVTLKYKISDESFKYTFTVLSSGWKNYVFICIHTDINSLTNWKNVGNKIRPLCNENIEAKAIAKITAHAHPYSWCLNTQKLNKYQQMLFGQILAADFFYNCKPWWYPRLRELVGFWDPPLAGQYQRYGC